MYICSIEKWALHDFSSYSKFQYLYKFPLIWFSARWNFTLRGNERFLFIKSRMLLCFFFVRFLSIAFCVQLSIKSNDKLARVSWISFCRRFVYTFARSILLIKIVSPCKRTLLFFRIQNICNGIHRIYIWKTKRNVWLI